MPRNMSVALTEDQCRAQTKDVTRRLGWRDLQPGQIVQLVRKGQGIPKGEHAVKVALVEIVSVTFERLDSITAAEVVREGFPEMTPAEFVVFFCGTHRGCEPGTVVTRIEWRYIEESDAERDARFGPGNDATWGVGQWVRCDACPPDQRGRQPYHHREAHNPQTVDGAGHNRGATADPVGSAP